MKHIKCVQCDGHYSIRSGKFGSFAGCSNYPNCKSTMKIGDYIYSLLVDEGINIYGWYRTCWKCEQETKVYTYFLNYDLMLLDNFFSLLLPDEAFTSVCNIGLGSFSTLDNYIMSKYPTVKRKYSYTVKDTYVANVCSHCGALQGKNYVVDDPEEVYHSLNFEFDMSKYIVENVSLKISGILASDFQDII